MDVCELLEARRLLSGIVFNSSTGLLTITGRDSTDVISVLTTGSSTAVRFNTTHQTFTSVDQVIIDGRGGNDVITINDSGTVKGGSGNDAVTVTGGRVTVDGGLGADTMTGSSAADVLLDYSSRTHPVTVSLVSGSTNNGEAGEHDKLVGEIHRVTGGSANDSLTGNDGDDFLRGGPGADKLDGGKGHDTAFRDFTDQLISIENAVNASGTGTVVRSGNTVTITGTANGDDLSIIGNFIDDPTTYIVLNDKEYQVTSDASIVCNLSGGDDHVDVNGFVDPQLNLGDGNDSVFVDRGSAGVVGGAGNDHVNSSDDSNVAFDGGSGQDSISVYGGDSQTLDLNQMPGVEDADLNSGTLIGNALNNKLLIDVGTIMGGDGNDTLTVAGEGLIDGGGGNDILLMDGGIGELRGGSGNDTLTGGDDDDTLDGGTGADVIHGGGGLDTVTYASRKNAVNVSLDNLANDGETSEHDNVASDVEKIIGGSGNDTLRGSSAANVLLGGGGNDSLYGGGGKDALFGGSGNDKLFGEADNDYLEGGSGKDTLDGGSGTDKALSDSSDLLISIEAHA